MVLKQKNPWPKKKRKKYTRMPRLGPQDPRVSGAAEDGQGGSATATLTQQVTVFGANDAAAEFRITVSSRMNLEYAVAPDSATGCIMSCPVYDSATGCIMSCPVFQRKENHAAYRQGVSVRSGVREDGSTCECNGDDRSRACDGIHFGTNSRGPCTELCGLRGRGW